MDTQLQELIDTIKAEGVQTAEKQAEQIIASAEEKARETVKSAEERAKKIIEDAHKEQANLDQSGRQALQQAARDLILGVQERLTRTFRSVVESAVGEAISADILENAIVSVVTSWSQGKEEGLDILLTPQDLSRLETRLRGRLAEQIKSGVEIRASEAVRNGFRVSSRDGSVYYDFTVDAIAEALSAYVGPRLKDVLREAAASDVGD